MKRHFSISRTRQPLLGLNLAGLAMLVFGVFSPMANASVTINYDIGEITKSGANKIAVGTVFFVALGTNNILDSISWTSGNRFILNDDILFGAAKITDGVAQGSLSGVAVGGSTGFTSNTTKLAAIFLDGVDDSIVDYATGILLNSAGITRTFGTTGGTLYNYGTYRTDLPEKFGATGATADIGWIVPADGGVYNLSAYSGTGVYTDNDINASLFASSNVIIIPEPSTSKLVLLSLAFGLAFLSKTGKLKLKKMGLILFLGGSLNTLLEVSSQAQTTVSTPVVGFTKLPLKAGSDTIIAPQVFRPSELSSTVTGVTSAGATAVLNLQGGSLSSNQFVYVSGSQPKTYVAIVTAGNLTGTYFSIAANSTSTITINLDGLTVGNSDITAIEVRPCWTLNTLFPSSDANVSFTPSTGTTTGARRTTLLIPDNTSVGVNKGSAAIYFYNNNASVQDWVTTTAPTVKAGDKVVLPGEYIIHRNSGGTPVDLNLTHSGAVLARPIAYYLDTSSSVQNDNYLSLPRPTDFTLAELGLDDSSFTQSTGRTTGTRRDVLLVVTQAGTSVNRSSSTVYFKFAGNWYSTAATSIVTNNAVIPAGSALIIRKYQADGTSKVWTNNLNISL